MCGGEGGSGEMWVQRDLTVKLKPKNQKGRHYALKIGILHACMGSQELCVQQTQAEKERVRLGIRVQ